MAEKSSHPSRQDSKLDLLCCIREIWWDCGLKRAAEYCISQPSRSAAAGAMLLTLVTSLANPADVFGQTTST
jgi:hypothetical protein